MCLNAENEILKTIDSILSQKYVQIEHIIIDAKSSDKTIEIIDSTRARYELMGFKLNLQSKRDNGIYDGMNKGLRAASGEIVGFLNAGDIFASEMSLFNISKCFKNNIKLVYGNVAFLDTYGEITRVFESIDFGFNENLYARKFKKDRFKRLLDSKFLKNIKILESKPTFRFVSTTQNTQNQSKSRKKSLFAQGLHPPHPSFYAKSEVYDRGFDTSYKIASDFEMMLYLMEIKKHRSFFLNEIIVKMSDGGISNKNIKNILSANIECYRACKKHNLSVNPTLIISKPLRKVAQLRRLKELFKKFFR